METIGLIQSLYYYDGYTKIIKISLLASEIRFDSVDDGWHWSMSALRISSPDEPLLMRCNNICFMHVIHI